MNYRMISYIIGCIWLFEAAFMLVPVVTALAYREQAVFAFLWTALICFGAGLLLAFKKPKNQTLRARDGFVVVSLSWIAISLLGALPFTFTGVTASYVDALFETVSGFTTTGATIFREVESLPRSILMWRSFTHWVGGMGVLVFIMAFVPLSGGRNMHIMKAESTGPDVGKLVPRVRTTAMLLYSIYLGLTLLQFVLLLFGGMNVFEALTTTFSTAGTGGFGVKNDSLLSYSPYIQIVVTVFMLLFSLNFGSYFLALRGKFKEAFNSEVRAFLLDTQRSIAAENSVVMDGRDIGTVILPQAQVKIFLVANDEERAQRRFAELAAKGDNTTYAEVLSSMRGRDQQDSTRKVAPAIPAPDAVHIDNTELTVAQTLALISPMVEAALA